MSELEREFWAGVFAAAVLFVMNVFAVCKTVAWFLRLPMRMWAEVRKS
jgi:hypothetical protein